MFKLKIVALLLTASAGAVGLFLNTYHPDLYAHLCKAVV